MKYAGFACQMALIWSQRSVIQPFRSTPRKPRISQITAMITIQRATLTKRLVRESVGSPSGVVMRLLTPVSATGRLRTP